MNNIIILRILQQINTWALLPGLAYLIYLSNIGYYLCLLVALILVSKVGASIGQHRYFTHRSFKMSLWKEKIVAVLAVLSTTGTTLQYVTVHRYHHLNSDRGKDLHSPHEIGYWRSFWHWYKDNPTKIVPLSMIKDLLKNSFLIKLHKYYLLIILLYIAILAIIDINLVLFCYMIPAGFSWWSSAVLSLPLHLSNQGYRNFDTNDETVNSHFWNCLTLGEGLHNNHHAKPYEYNFAFTKKPWEWDISAIIIDKFLKCKT
jgi:stearoyl-CoA desaturase (delta-9 desaturase)